MHESRCARSRSKRLHHSRCKGTPEDSVPESYGGSDSGGCLQAEGEYGNSPNRRQEHASAQPLPEGPEIWLESVALVDLYPPLLRGWMRIRERGGQPGHERLNYVRVQIFGLDLHPDAPVGRLLARPYLRHSG